MRLLPCKGRKKKTAEQDHIRANSMAPPSKKPTISSSASGSRMPRLSFAASTTQSEHIPNAPKLHKVTPRSPFGALFSRTLPAYTGTYSVGVADIEVPVRRQTFGTFKHKLMPDAEAGLVLDTVLFSVFYPCDVPKKAQHVVWFPR